jgi:hypothetical protein
VNIEPLRASRISVTADDIHPVIAIPHRRSPNALFHRRFMLVWLCGWFAVFSLAVSMPFSPSLAAWTLAGAFEAHSAYRRFALPFRRR